MSNRKVIIFPGRTVGESLWCAAFVLWWLVAIGIFLASLLMPSRNAHGDDEFADHVLSVAAERLHKGDLVHWNASMHGWVKSKNRKFALGRAYSDTEAWQSCWIELFGNGT